ncbi:unnamed protein product [Blepharisma stoltei]|uniref:XPA C-terminal domain-containing protein n=1 Tax=Blepharisma stoltei TaxID=1481888 RepID=A0AAU9IMR2_9CILI|nr:unnamed protein product [Blepharisma stoltei]
MDFTYRSMPIRSLSRINPLINQPKQQIKDVPRTGQQRLWILVSHFLSIPEIFNLMKTCKMLYIVSYEPELWHDILISQFQSKFVLSIINGSYQDVNIVTRIDYKLEAAIIDEYIPIYCDEVTKEDENDLFELFQTTGLIVDQAPPLTSADLNKVDPNEFRNIALILYQLSCIECHNIKIDCFYCKVLRKSICLKCLKSDKYKMLSIGSCKSKFKITQEELDSLNLNYAEATNPINYGFSNMKLYYEFQVKKALEKHKIPSYMRFKEIENKLEKEGYADAVSLAYGKIVEKFLKGKDDNLDRCVIYIIKRYERSKNAAKNGKKRKLKN